MGSIVKKIKKVVKKVVKKNPITKIIKKQVKRIKKLGSKVWQGIKKVGGKAFKAFGKFSQKLGPIGMIALSFAMPYLTAGMGSMWGAMGNALNAGMSSTNAFVSTLSTVGNTAYQALGTAGSFVKGTYQGITQTISKTFQGFSGPDGSISKGFSNLWGGTKDVVTGKAGLGTQQFATREVLGQTVTEATGQLVKGASGVVNTGGVSAFSANQANKLAYQSISNAMKSTTSLYSPEMQKYANTLQQQYNINSYDAHQYVMKNGGYTNDALGTLELDFTKSKDFLQLKPNSNFTYNGANAKLNYADSGTQYLGVKENLGNIQGETYGYGSAEKPSLLNRAKDKGIAALSALAGDTPEENGYVPYGGSDTYLNSMIAGYGGSNVDTSSGGQFLSEDQRRFAENQKSLLNFRGTANA